MCEHIETFCKLKHPNPNVAFSDGCSSVDGQFFPIENSIMESLLFLPNFKGSDASFSINLLEGGCNALKGGKKNSNPLF